MTVYTVNPDALAILNGSQHVFEVPYAITGKLRIVAKDKSDAWRQALRYDVQELAAAGDLEMDDPREPGVLGDLRDGREG
jgi:predicted GTPase